MSFYLNQTATGSTTTAHPVTAAFTYPVSKNSLIVVGWTTSGTFSSISDTLSTSYTLIDNSTSPTSRFYYGVTTAAGANTVSIDTTANANSTIIVREYPFLQLPVATLDQHTFASGTSNNPNSGASGTTTAELVVGYVACNNAGSVYTIGAGFSNLITKTATGQSAGMEDKIVLGSLGTQTATMTVTLSPAWNAYVATFIGGRPSLQPNNLRPAVFKPGLAR